MKKHFLLILCLVLFLFEPLKSQQLWGVANSNYAGVSSLLINPALMSDSKSYFDINFITFDIFTSNNYLYIPKDELYFFELFSPSADFNDHHTKPVSDFYERKRNTNAYASSRLILPSIMLNLSPNAFAFHWAVRGDVSARNMDYRGSKLGFEGIDYEPLQHEWLEIRNAKLSGLTWAEFGLSYARVINQIMDHHLALGGSIKYLKGMGGAYFNVPYAHYIIPNDTTIDVEEFTGEYAASLPIDYQNSDYYIENGLFLGSGIGIDLGFVYQRKREGNGLQRYKYPCQQRWESYKYKIGFSLLDLGFISLKDNITAYRFDHAHAYWPGASKFDPGSIEGFNQEMATQFSVTETNEKKITIGLPTAISVQLDHHPVGYWFYNLSILQPIPVFKNSLRRPAQIVLAPRYEKPRFEFAVPVSLYDWYKPRLGFAVRLLNFTIGTDDFLQLTGWQHFTGFDLYFSWKKSFHKGNCRKGASNFHRGKRYYQQACPVF